MAKETKVGFTAFNMKEELEEGHFDKNGHYLWKKEKQIRDNWLDNIDWVKVIIFFFFNLFISFLGIFICFVNIFSS